MKFVPDPVRVISHNVFEPRPGHVVARSLVDDVREFQPHLILLQEARGIRSALKHEFAADYRIKGVRGGSQLSLVRRDVRASTHYLRMDVPWTGPKMGLRQEPRVYPVTRVGEIVVVNTHRVTPGFMVNGLTDNEDAWMEEHRKLRRLIDNHRGHGRGVALIGDHNYNHADIPERFAENQTLVGHPGLLGRKVVDGQRGKDYALLTSNLLGSVRNCGPNGSDHPLMRVKVWSDQ